VVISKTLNTIDKHAISCRHFKNNLPHARFMKKHGPHAEYLLRDYPEDSVGEIRNWLRSTMGRQGV
jgi:hypothetical protein